MAHRDGGDVPALLALPPEIPTDHHDARPVARDATRSPFAAPFVSLSELLSALSHALDLAEGQPLGHTVRSCVIGMRIAESLELSDEDRSALYYALLLKDAGCSSNAARTAALFGSDDRLVKPRMRVVDWHRRIRLAVHAIRSCATGRGAAERMRHVAAIARAGDVTRELIAARGDRGAEIARQLGFPDATTAAIRSLDEHWCGRGYPEGLREERIPILARIAGLAQTVEIFHARGGIADAAQVIRDRRGRWFDPRLADVVLDWQRDRAWWNSLGSDAAYEMVLAAEPEDQTRYVDDRGLDDVAHAFAEIVDSKSPYTYRHSTSVARYARAMAYRTNMDARQVRQLHRAALLHDIGMLGVSNRILDKPSPLAPEERVELQKHPVHTLTILEHVSAFRGFARVAAFHHERLDGSGYPWGFGSGELDQPARILAVADVYEALVAERPYRSGMPHEDAMLFLRSQRGAKLCSDAIDALESLPSSIAARSNATG